MRPWVVAWRNWRARQVEQRQREDFPIRHLQITHVSQEMLVINDYELPPGFSFGDSDIEQLTYPKLDRAYQNLDDLLELSNRSLATIPISKPETDLGTIAPFSLEILYMILPQLDLDSLANFRLVNRQAALVVSFLPQYRTIVKHAPATLRAIRKIQTGRWITSELLHTKLQTRQCEQCGDLAGYIYLITCKRLCYRCSTCLLKYRPVTLQRAIEQFDLDPDLLSTLPQMTLPPWPQHSSESTDYDSSLVGAQLIDVGSAYAAAVHRRGSHIDLCNRITALGREQRYVRYLKCVRSSRSAAGLPPLFLKDHSVKAMAVLRVPWLDERSRELEWGFHCRGCVALSEDSLYYGRLFTLDTFERHLRDDPVGKSGEMVHARNLRSCRAEGKYK